MAELVVVLSAESDARWREGEPPLVVQGFPCADGTVSITFQTRYADEGHEARVPREMWVDARGATDLDFVDAISAFAQAAAAIVPAIAVSTNAYVGQLKPKLAYDNSPGLRARDFFQSFVREEVNTIPNPARRVKNEHVVALLRGLHSHPRHDRLGRAVAQYAIALEDWFPGHETGSLAHLWMGMEALTEIAVVRELEGSGLDENALATRMGVSADRPGQLRTALSAEIRCRVLFQGDRETYRNAKRASDGFEHGFLDFARIRGFASEARDKTATYLRQAILDIPQIDRTIRDEMLASPRDIPLRSHLTRYIWGELVGDGTDPALPDQEYPVLEWKSRLQSLLRKDDGTYVATPDEGMTVRISDSYVFGPRRFEVWGPAGLEAQPAPGEASGEGTELAS